MIYITGEMKDIIIARLALLFLKLQCQKLERLAAVWRRYGKKAIAKNSSDFTCMYKLPNRYTYCQILRENLWSV